MSAFFNSGLLFSIGLLNNWLISRFSKAPTLKHYKDIVFKCSGFWGRLHKYYL